MFRAWYTSRGPSRTQSLRYTAAGVPTEYPLPIPRHPNSQPLVLFRPVNRALSKNLPNSSSVKTYNTPQAQSLFQSDSNWNALFAPPIAATMYRSTPKPLYRPLFLKHKLYWSRTSIPLRKCKLAILIPGQRFWRGHIPGAAANRGRTPTFHTGRRLSSHSVVVPRPVKGSDAAALYGRLRSLRGITQPGIRRLHAFSSIAG